MPAAATPFFPRLRSGPTHVPASLPPAEAALLSALATAASDSDKDSHLTHTNDTDDNAQKPADELAATAAAQCSSAPVLSAGLPPFHRLGIRDWISLRRKEAMFSGEEGPARSPVAEADGSVAAGAADDGSSDRVLLPSNSFEHVQVDDRAPPSSTIRIDREGNSRRSKSAQLDIQPGDLLPDEPATATATASLSLPPLHPASSPDHSDAETETAHGDLRTNHTARRTLDAPLSVMLTPARAAAPPPADGGRRSAPRSRRSSGSLRPDLPLSPSPPTGSPSAVAALANPPALVPAVVAAPSAVPAPSSLLPPLTPDTELVFDFQCEGLDRMHLLYKASPYIELYVCARSNIELKGAGASRRGSGRGNFFESVYKTETVLHKLHPVFKRIVVSAHALCRCEYDRMIMIRVWDESRSGDDAMLMGECQATVRDLILPLYSKETDALRIPLVRPELKASKAGYTNSGFLVVTSVARYRQIDRLPGAPKSKSKHRRATSSAKTSRRASKEGAMPAVNAEAAVAVATVDGAVAEPTDRERRHRRHKSASNLDETAQDKEERRRRKDKEKANKKKTSKPSSRSHSRDVSDDERDDDPASPAVSGAVSLSSVSLSDFVLSCLSVVGVSISGLSKSSWLSAPNPFFVIYGRDTVDRAWRDKNDKQGTIASAEAMRVGGAGSGKPVAAVAAALAALVAPSTATTVPAPAAASAPAVAAGAVPASASTSTTSSTVPANPILAALTPSPSCGAWIPQWTSEVKNNALAADFDPFVLDVSALCNGDWEQQILVAVCYSADDVKIVKPELIGSCALSVREFLTGSASAEDGRVDATPLETVPMNANQQALIAQRQAQASRPASVTAAAGAASAPSAPKVHARKKSTKQRDLTLLKPAVSGSKSSSPNPSPSPPLPACTFHVRLACLLESLVGPRLHSFADDSEALLKEMAMVRVGAFGSAAMTPTVRSASPATVAPSPPPTSKLAGDVTATASASTSASASASASGSSSSSSSSSAVPPSLKRFATLSIRDGGVVFVGGSATNGGNEEKGHSRRATLDRRLSLERAASTDSKAASALKDKDKDKPATLTRTPSR